METVSKNFTGFDIFAMIVPGLSFLFGIGFLMIDDRYNVFVMFKDLNYVSEILVVLSISYIIGTFFSNTGTLFFKNSKKKTVQSLENQAKIILKNQYNYNEEELNDTKLFYEAMKRLLRLKPKYNSQLNVFFSLKGLCKSTCVALSILMILQIFTYGNEMIIQFYYENCCNVIKLFSNLIILIAFESILFSSFIKRTNRMSNYYDKYLLEYFVQSNKEE